MKRRADDQFLGGLRLFLISLGSLLALFWILSILGDNTLLACMIGSVSVIVLFIGYGWVQLFKKWKRQFWNTSNTGHYRIVSLVDLLLLVGIAGSITALFLELFGLL
jgi:uncharacterized membrane protein